MGGLREGWGVNPPTRKLRSYQGYLRVDGSLGELGGFLCMNKYTRAHALTRI